MNVHVHFYKDVHLEDLVAIAPLQLEMFYIRSW